MRKYTISMLGEKDHGKSTLLGNLLIATGSTTEARINEVKKMAKKRFEPAFILDSFSEERENEMTIDTTRASVVYRDSIFEFIDVPGHLELIRNMLSGASNGDMSVLLVSAKPGEGFRPQTRRHLFLSSMMGINALIVVVNKLDEVGYSRSEFERVSRNVGAYLRDIGFERPVHFVPISAYNDENLVRPSKKMGWYRGKPLIELVAVLARKSARAGPKTAELRLLVQDVMGAGKEADIFGIVHNGSIGVGEKVHVEPQGAPARVAALYVKGKPSKSAPAGTNVALRLDGYTGTRRGNVIYGGGGRPYLKNNVTAKMYLVRGINQNKASEISLKVNNNEIPLSGIRVNEVVSPVSGRRVQGRPGRISANNSVTARLTLKNDYPFERFVSFRELGRFTVYRRGEFIGIGIVV